MVNCVGPAVAELSGSVTVTSLFGSAPESALPLTVEVDVQRETVPSRFTFPVGCVGRRWPVPTALRWPGWCRWGYPGTV